MDLNAFWRDGLTSGCHRSYAVVESGLGYYDREVCTGTQQARFAFIQESLLLADYWDLLLGGKDG